MSTLVVWLYTFITSQCKNTVSFNSQLYTFTLHSNEGINGYTLAV